MSVSGLEIFTIGHSSQSYNDFVSLLRFAGINAVADVRTAPYSRNFPHFNRDEIQKKLNQETIAYVFLGTLLGGRPSQDSLFRDGVADYEKMAELPNFKKGIARVLEGAQTYRIALMCSEHHPMECHRCLLVGRALYEKGIKINHILSNRQILDHSQIEEQLIRTAGKEEKDLFETDENRRKIAYRNQALRVAYSKPLPAERRKSAAAE